MEIHFDDSQSITVFDSQTKQHCQALQYYLSHSDETDQCKKRLSELVELLPQRNLFLDVGAGTGRYTVPLFDKFKQTIALEPNQTHQTELRHNCPEVEIRPDTISEAQIKPASANFILCAHVFYFIDPQDWMVTLEKVASWLAPHGLLVAILACPEGTCMHIYEHFYQHRLDFDSLAQEFEHKNRDNSQVTLETLPVKITASTFEAAYRIAEFLINPPPPGCQPPARQDVEAYIKNHCFIQDDQYLFSCNQYLLQIRKPVME